MFTNFPFRQRCTCDTINPVLSQSKGDPSSSINNVPALGLTIYYRATMACQSTFNRSVVAVQLNSELQMLTITQLSFW